MRALVTGASGFVGRHLTAHLRECGDEVAGVDREDGVDITDQHDIERAMQSFRPEVVYHLAGWSDVGRSWASPVEVFRANAEGTLNVLLAARVADVGRVVTVTSSDIYGVVTEDELPVTEDAHLRPISPYAVSKVAADYLGLQAWLGHGLNVIRARAFNHLGSGQGPGFVAPAIAQRIARSERDGSDVVRVGNLTPRRDFTDVRDVVRAYRLLARQGEPGRAYNICSGVDVSIGELAERLVALAARPLRLEPDPELQRKADLPVLRGDHSLLTTATGWKPEIDLDTTLADVLNDWRARLTE
jgi:GDP-4-dehydro-6-deoxy-D-mannose reductase